ncbi:bifunctional folylpolyglutamate synthase/dihydrofolate synthase [Bombilactobacillus bombi]|uniref:bifunctional folylpolyglutamate synthase/dihydrofolate synthase n=1 Tax=Bombilactobacillus bombi TaxID=1303590 RepID=UPI0015E5C496|nr:folylpolyglutamate synthase/dihydrofolate synthase family protein [Bombilactobacillus bombi]
MNTAKFEFDSAATAISYIHQLPHLHPQKSLKYVKKALEGLDNPQQKIKTVHVTGTNGKGTVCYYLTQMLINSGFKVGTFASPYVQTFNERIQINQQPINDKDLVALTQKTAQLVSKIQQEDPDFYLVQFEFLTVMMFQFFAQERIDYGIIEVGVGGEHDKTNVITPLLSIITNVGLDHAQLIGPTLEDIAQEKAGVIKSARPVILGEIPLEVQSIIHDRAQKLAAPIYSYQKDFTVKQLQRKAFDLTTFDWCNSQYHFSDLKVASFADTQVIDAAIAIQAYLLLCPQNYPQTVVKTSLAVASLPGRMQILSKDPLIILDGAHNLPAIEALLTNLKAISQQKRLVVLYAAMVDKQRDAILQKLQPTADEIIITTTEEKRSAKVSDYQDLTSKEHFVAPWPVAFAQALTSLDSESMLVICGSLHFASDILEMLKSSNN